MAKALETELSGKLYPSRKAEHGIVDLSNTCTGKQHCCIGKTECWGVGEVPGINAEIEFPALSQAESLGQGSVRVELAGADEVIPARITHLSGQRLR